MKLTNPTDEQLNAAFAEKVAGWKRTGRRDNTGEIWTNAEGVDLFDFSADLKSALQPDDFGFCTDANAVLTWLERHYLTAKYWTGQAGERPVWRIGVERAKSYQKSGQHTDMSFARAAVVAMLRSHGVEVEFTK